MVGAKAAEGADFVGLGASIASRHRQRMPASTGASLFLPHLLIVCPRVVKRAAPGLVIPTRETGSKTDRFRDAVAYVQTSG
jgi:hypothetical protein